MSSISPRSHHQRQVEEFMRLAGQSVPSSPCIPDEQTRILRAKLMFEEVMETIRALGVSVYWNMPSREELDAEGGAEHFVGVCVSAEQCKLSFDLQGEVDLVEVVDGCADVAVVTTGTLVTCGIADFDVQNTVNFNNLAKFGPGGYRADGTPEKPGPVGKWMKPPNHQPPDIAGIIEAQKRA